MISQATPQSTPLDKQTLTDYLRQAISDIPLPPFVLDLILCAVFGYLLGRLYIRCGRTLSNRREFARNFPMLVLTTMLVISIVKSSLALSLGLVGALSIVRFRSAIKEPEELTYLFLAIAVGLGFGGNQRVITICAFFVIAAIILISSRPANKEPPTLHVTITGPQSTDLDSILSLLRPHCTDLHLLRLDETHESLEVAMHISFGSVGGLNAARKALRDMSSPLTVSFLDTQGLG
ncbi:MAG: DUF4956 domain-containing protein [Planctomycetes bacterium]|jgi:hypothetical protein|nr:DUF4956 domain-containing protein [Planctomycetota bacterium]MDP6424987.1 DUF4956 domain-containing protein [Planctomycetota bacterium]